MGLEPRKEPGSDGRCASSASARRNAPQLICQAWAVASESLWLLLHLKSLVSLHKEGAEADGVNLVQGTCWALGTANESSSSPALSYPHFIEKESNVQGGSEF